MIYTCDVYLSRELYEQIEMSIVERTFARGMMCVEDRET